MSTKVEQFVKYKKRFDDMHFSLLHKLHCSERDPQGITIHTRFDPEMLEIIGLPMKEAAVTLMEFICTYHFKLQFQTIGHNVHFQFKIFALPLLWQNVHIRTMVTQVAGNTVKIKCEMSTRSENPVSMMSCVQTKNIM